MSLRRPEHRRKPASRIPGDAAAERVKLLKIRAVLMLQGTRHGEKATAARELVAALKAMGVTASVRTIYVWRSRYLRSGRAGIDKRLRSDSGRMRAGGRDVFERLLDAVQKVRRHGDIAREFRRGSWPFGREMFRIWVHRIQRRVLVMPARRKHGIVL